MDKILNRKNILIILITIVLVGIVVILWIKPNSYAGFNYDGGGPIYETKTTTIHHDEVGHWENVVIQPAWDETLVVGYECSGCGATK